MSAALLTVGNGGGGVLKLLNGAVLLETPGEVLGGLRIEFVPA